MTAVIGTGIAGSEGRLTGMIVAFSVAPAVVDNDSGEMADAVAEAVRVVRESGLPNETNAMFTLVEGEWDEVSARLRRPPKRYVRYRRAPRWLLRPISAKA